MFIPMSTEQNPEKNQVGPPEHKATYELRQIVLRMATNGVPQFLIARDLGIDPKTLRKHYRKELDEGSENATDQVRAYLFKRATGRDIHGKPSSKDSVSASIFWMKTKGGWSEK